MLILIFTFLLCHFLLDFGPEAGLFKPVPMSEIPTKLQMLRCLSPFSLDQHLLDYLIEHLVVQRLMDLQLEL